MTISFRVIAGILALGFTIAVAAAANPPLLETSPAVPTARPASAAERDYWRALTSFRSTLDRDLVAGRRQLDAAAAGEFTFAQVLLGECYQSGAFGYPKSDQKAAAQFRLAAERGNAFAQTKFSACLVTGAGTSVDFDAAMKWLNAALAPNADYSRPQPPKDLAESAPPSTASVPEIVGVAAGDLVAFCRAQAHFLLAIVLEAKGMASEAQNNYVMAGMAGPGGRDGIQPAAMQAAVNYAFGRGVPRDRDKAVAMLEQGKRLVRRSGIWMVHDYLAAKQVDEFAVAQMEDAVASEADRMKVDAQMEIGQTFTDPNSKEFDPKEAAKWFELAAKSGRAWAMSRLGLLYSSSDLGKPDPARAFGWFEQAGDGDKPKDRLATANLVICLMNGLGTSRDPVRALAIAKRQRNEDFICYLATIGHCPESVVTLEAEFALAKIWATTNDDPHSQYFYGNCNYYGRGVKRDYNEGMKWYKKAIDRGDGHACYLLGNWYEKYPDAASLERGDNLEWALDYYQRGVKAGDALACCNLAFMYSEGRGVKADDAKADALWEKAVSIDPTQSDSLNCLGVSYQHRFEAAQKAGKIAEAETYRLKAIDFYQRAEQNGSPYGTENLGWFYYDGVIGGKPDYEKAYVYLERAAGRGVQNAMLGLATMLEKGQGVPVSLTEAAYYLRMAALNGGRELLTRKALSRLVDYYVEGKGGTQDFDRALFWLYRLVQTGNVGAKMQIADILLKQRYYDSAAFLFEELCEVRDTRVAGFAYERLSRCYRDGLGKEVNPAKALSCLKKALSLGDGDAMLRMANSALAEGKEAEAVALFKNAAKDTAAANYALGQMCYFGQHMPKDLEQAMLYIRKAADGKNRDAQYFLAVMCFNRDSGAPPIDEAICLAASAEALGHPQGGALRDKLERRRQKENSGPSQSTTGVHPG